MVKEVRELQRGEWNGGEERVTRWVKSEWRERKNENGWKNGKKWNEGEGENEGWRRECKVGMNERYEREGRRRLP